MFARVKRAAASVKNLVTGESGWVNLTDQGGFGASGYKSVSGKVVSAETAMNISAVFDCVRKTSERVSTIPAGLFETNRDGSVTRLENDLDAILTIQPNAQQTAQEFWEGMTAQTVLKGNALAEKLFIGNRLVGLDPMPDAVPVKLPGGGFQYERHRGGRKDVLPASKVFHLRGFGAGDGLGLSAVKYGAGSMGAALSADESAGAVFANGMMASGVLHTEQTLDEVQRGQLQKMLEAYTGSKRAGKVMTLEAGLKYSQLQMNPDDAQLLETRRFNVEDVCRWFGTPPIIVGHSSAGQTMWGSGIEAVMLSWLALGINPRLVRIENRVKVDLVPVERRRRWGLKFDRDNMLQMDSKSKGDFMSKMSTSGTMTANERREVVGLPRHNDPAADKLMIQGAMVSIDDLLKGNSDG